MNDSDPRWLRRLDALYGLALDLYPRRFRNAWQAEMRQAFRDRCREVARGERRPIALIREMLPDLAAGVGRERLLDVQDATMFKRNLLFALLLVFGATVLLQERVSAAVEDTHQWWLQRQAQLQAEAARDHWTGLAVDLENSAKSPHEHALAGFAWSRAGSMQRAQSQWDAAVAGGDLVALWVSATDCPVPHCDAAAAVARMQSNAPGNAAVEQLAFNQAFIARDNEAMLAAMARIYSAHRYHDYSSDLLKSLLRVNGGTTDADMLVADVRMRLAQPDFGPLLDVCKPSSRQGAQMASNCATMARVMANGNTLASRAFGGRILLRYAHGSPEQPDAVARRRDWFWPMANIANLGMDETPEAYARWRQAFLASEGEVEALHRLMRERGIALSAPGDFEVEAKYLDPAR